MAGLAGAAMVMTAASQHSDVTATVESMAHALAHRGAPQIYEYGPYLPGVCADIAVTVALLGHRPDDMAAVSGDGLVVVSGPNSSEETASGLYSALGCMPERPDSPHFLGLLSSLFSQTAVCIHHTGVWLIRSEDGTLPVYYSPDSGLRFCTERKGLWELGCTDVHVVAPGEAHVIKWPLTGQPVVLEWAEWIRHLAHGTGALTHVESGAPPQGHAPVGTTTGVASRREALDLLASCLTGSFRRLRGASRVGVLFSGGVDSSLAALMASMECDDVVLFTTSAPDGHDRQAARRAADLLGLRLVELVLTESDVWTLLPSLVYAIESSRRMDVEIALPFYVSARAARAAGCSTLVSGQGPDELFGGYDRHLRMFVESGPDTVARALAHDVATTHSNNIGRDERAIAAHGLTAHFPYLDPAFVRAAMALPVEWRMSWRGGPCKKGLFRELAVRMGLPEELAVARKRATQYSSGSHRLLYAAVRRYCWQDWPPQGAARGVGGEGSTRTERGDRPSRRDVEASVQVVLDMLAEGLGVVVPRERPGTVHTGLPHIRRAVQQLLGDTSRQQ